MNCFIGILIVPVFLIVSCASHEKKNSAAEVADTLSYEIVTDSPYEMKVYGIISRQQLIVETIYHNTTGESVQIFPLSFQLHTTEGLRATPINEGPASFQLDPGQSQKFIVRYEPVHNRRLYQQTGLRGDLAAVYNLAVNGPNEIVELKTDENLLQQSINAYGLKATTLPYVLEFQNNFTEQQKAHFDNFFADSWAGRIHSIHLAENEILMNGFWTKIETFHRSDTLFIRMRIANKSGLPVQIITSELTLRAGHDEIASSEPNEILKLRDGDRVSLSLRFPTVKLDSYRLNLSAIQHDWPRPVSFFAMPLTVTRLDTF